MFNIAICDDEETLIDELKENLIKYAAETNKEFCFFIYHDGSVYFKEGIWFCQSPFLYQENHAIVAWFRESFSGVFRNKNS